MLEFLSLKPKTFGLDISDLSLKIIKLKKKRDSFTLASFLGGSIKPGVIKDGEIKNEKNLVNIVKKALTQVKGEKLKTKYAVVSLPEEKAFLQVIQMPRLPAEDLRSAVIYEAENYIPLPIEEVYLDSQIIPPAKENLNKLNVLLAALPKKTIDPYLSVLLRAGLQPIAFEIESLAIARALIKDEVAPSPVLLIDLGATRTSFIVFSGRSLRFTFSMPVSSQKFTEIISRALKISLSEAENLKLKYGLKRGASKKGGEIFEALIPALTDLIEQIKKYINYYQTHTSQENLSPENKGIKKILLCGGGANLKGLADFLSQELKLPVVIGNPWMNILPESQKEPSELPLEKSLGYTTALGLALRGFKNL